MQRLGDIRTLLRDYGLSPRKRLGQNFLIDQNHIARLVERAGVGPDDLVLEVGPGTGTLTESLLDAGAEVIACEVDRGLCAMLRDRLGDRDRFTLVEDDCLAGKRELSPMIVDRLEGRAFMMVANLPYAIATPLIMTLLINHPECAGMWVTVQREVADRLLAEPGSKTYGPISVVRWTLAEGERIARLGPGCFWPQPEVESAMVALRRHPEPRTGDPGDLAGLCRRIFASRRKQVGSVLGRDLTGRVGIDPSVRAEQLDPDSIEALRVAVAAW